jgi:hypothetical protein
MDWLNRFERHLNWTFALAILVISPVVYGIAHLFGLLFFDDPKIGVWDNLILILIFIGLLILIGWFLTKKGRSLWWIILSFIPFFGFILILLLDNKNELIIKDSTPS